MTVSAAGPATDDNSPPGEASPQPERRPQGIDRTVLGVAAAVSVLFVGWGIVATDNLASVTGTALDWVARSFGWVFVLASAGFVVLSIWLALSRYGRIKLGRDDDKPEFSTVSWVAMMFSAGMGIGLMFWGAAEPLSHLGTRRAASTRRTPSRPRGRPWSTPSSTGRCTRGRSMPWWG